MSSKPTSSPSKSPSAGPTKSPSLSPTSSPTPCSGKYVKVNILTDNYPEETFWELKNTCTDEIVKSVSAGRYDAKAQVYEDEFCVPEGSYEYTIHDTFGDGVCCKHRVGAYTVVYDDVQVASGGQFNKTETTSFGECPSSSPSVSPSATPTSSAPTVS